MGYKSKKSIEVITVAFLSITAVNCTTMEQAKELYKLIERMENLSKELNELYNTQLKLNPSIQYEPPSSGKEYFRVRKQIGDILGIEVSYLNADSANLKQKHAEKLGIEEHAWKEFIERMNNYVRLA